MSFQQGLSGLNATSKSLEVIGNNIANANTYGAKSSRAEFADVYAASLNGAGTNSVGIGTTLTAVAQQFTQGNITTTENPMDLAINGAGFFQVMDGANQTLYTRNGQFKVDREGYIVNNQRQKLLGYPAVDGVLQPGQATPLQLPTAGINPKATATIDFEVNLDSRVAPNVVAFDPADPLTYHNARALTIYDAKGQDLTVTLYFKKTATDTWDVFAAANGATIGAGPITTVTFDPDGTNPAFAPDPPMINVPVGTLNSLGAEIVTPLGMELNLGTATQFGAGFGVTNLLQDGYAAGQLIGIAVEDNGVVTARYSNGQTKPAGQLELANFRNPQGLQPMGGNAWARTYASGDPIVSVPGDGTMGVLQSGALEESNVDLTAELVNMITAQRVYQANAQSIKTLDQVMQTLVNLR